MNIFDRIAGRIADPEATAIETPEGARITYSGLVARSGRMANALVALGVAPGDRVAVQVEKSVEALILYLAAVRAGAVFLPLNTAYTPAEVAYFLADAEPPPQTHRVRRREGDHGHHDQRADDPWPASCHRAPLGCER